MCVLMSSSKVETHGSSAFTVSLAVKKSEESSVEFGVNGKPNFCQVNLTEMSLDTPGSSIVTP
jgi:hypothetical protein